MVFRDKKLNVSRRFFGRLPGIFFIALFLTGCAETSPTAIRQVDPASGGTDLDQHVVDGQGTAQDRAAINASNQRIFDAEHAGGPVVTTAPPAPSQPQGGIPQ